MDTTGALHVLKDADFLLDETLVQSRPTTEVAVQFHRRVAKRIKPRPNDFHVWRLFFRSHFPRRSVSIFRYPSSKNRIENLCDSTPITDKNVIFMNATLPSISSVAEPELDLSLKPVRCSKK